jgi:TetR/AcrR family transcriptional regulator, regulator of autoinduction and epiphytic fitness
VSDDVKRDQPTQAGRRQARTRLARRAVVAASRTLFLQRGYAATTIEAISNLADVPPATIYRHFASKLGILKALLNTSIAGNDQPLTVQERPNVASLFAEPDSIKLLVGFAGVTTAINQRTNDVYRVVVGAAGSDPAAAEILNEIQTTAQPRAKPNRARPRSQQITPRRPGGT